ncbi:MAG: DNA recombination protein RmuC [Clostridiales bacterium]|jgi:DNA recombination protein RmuC|nr:DNA recombination protein RmuC [Clostridiales bacterium]
MEKYILFAVIALNLILIVLVLTVGRSKKYESELFRLSEDIEELKTKLAVILQQIESSSRSSADEFERGRREQAEFQRELRTQTAESLNTIAAKLGEMTKANFEHQQKLTVTLSESLNTIRTNNIEQNERQSRVVSDAITKMQESNEKKLDEMRATVDEKLSTTLTSRLDASFKTVSEQLQNVYKSLGEMKELSTGVTDNVTSLNRVLTNVKARGTWAEIQLGSILDQTIPNMYERNFSTNKETNQRVEFAVRIPSGESSDENIYLPIDSKFPIEDYIRLCEAADNADAAGVDAARKALERRVIESAKDIGKYINVPETTPFAIMYLATEGLYAEIASSRTGLPERLQHDFNVMIAGPTTITALLNSLSMGLKSIAINKKANEVVKLLGAIKDQYNMFGNLLEKAKKKVEDAGKTIDEAQNRNRIIKNKLKSVESIESTQADDLLGLIEAAEED